MEPYDGGIWIESHPKEPLDQEQMFSHIKLGKEEKKNKNKTTPPNPKQKNRRKKRKKK